jgi:hypothetical protein
MEDLNLKAELTKIMIKLDHAARQSSIELAETIHLLPEITDTHRFHAVAMSIGEFRDRVRRLFRNAEGKLPNGFAEA